MTKFVDAKEAITPAIIPPGSKIYCAGNAATPQVLLQEMANNEAIFDVDMYSILPLGKAEVMEKLFSEKVCQRITHRVIFNSHYSRDAVNKGRAKYQLWHLSEVPRNIRERIRPNIVFCQVSGPDRGGNYSLGSTVEAVLAAIETAKENGGILIAERNKKMPFVLGTTIPEWMIDYIVDVDYDLPASPVKPPDDRSRRIGEIIAKLFVQDGCTLQYGIGEVPEAVTEAIIQKGVKNLGIHTELFADAMARLVKAGVVTNRHKPEGERFSVSSIFLASSQEAYDWLSMNSSIQSRPCDYTNSILTLAELPRMISVNSAIGVDLHGNIWADSLDARKIYSGVGGQSDFLRGSRYSSGGLPILALKATTRKGVSKIANKHPEGITLTATAADKVIVVTEHGAVDTRGLSVGEQALAIAYLAGPTEHREELLKIIYNSPEFYKPKKFVGRFPNGFFPYNDIIDGTY